MLKFHHRNVDRKKVCVLTSPDSSAVAGLACAMLLNEEMRTCTICTSDEHVFKIAQILRQRHRVMVLKRRIALVRNEMERGEYDRKEDETEKTKLRVVRCTDTGCTSRAAEQADVVLIFEWSVNEDDAEQIVDELNASCVCVFSDEKRQGVLCEMLKSESEYVSYEHGACGTLSAGISLSVFCRDHTGSGDDAASPKSLGADRHNRASVWDKRFGGETCPSFGDPVGG